MLDALHVAYGKASEYSYFPQTRIRVCGKRVSLEVMQGLLESLRIAKSRFGHTFRSMIGMMGIFRHNPEV